MKYLLSDGTTTIEYHEYLFDVLKVRVNAALNMIPWYKYGFDSTVMSLNKSDIEHTIHARVSSLVAVINKEKGSNITVSDLVINSDSSYSITLKFNDHEGEIHSRYR